MMRTTIRFGRLAGLTIPDDIVVDQALDAFDVVDQLAQFVETVRPGVRVEIDVDLVTGGRDGRFWIYAQRRPVADGSITLTEHSDEPAPVVVTYTTGEAILKGDVVQIGRLGSAIHEVIEVHPATVWLRETSGRRRQSQEPGGRLRLLERRFG